MTKRKSARFRVRQCFILYPPDYRAAFAFSAIPYPQRQQFALRLTCRFRQHDGLTLFRMNFRTCRTPPLRRRPHIHDGPLLTVHTWPHTFWFKPVSTLGLSSLTAFNQWFTYVGRHRSSLAPLHLGAGRFDLPSRVGLPITSAGTLSPELHTVLLPAPHVRVGNSRWNYRFRSGHKASCETEIHATFRSH